MLPIVINILLAVHVLVSLLIVLVVLMQRPKNEGLGAAFGGGMTENLFGAQTTNVLQTITRWLGALFFILTLTLSYLYVKQSSSKSAVQKRLLESAPVAAPATPAPVTSPADPKLPPAATEPVKGDGTQSIPTPAPAPDAKVEKPAPGAVSPAVPAPVPAEPAKPADAPAPPKVEGEAANPANPAPPASEAPAAPPAPAPAENPAK